MNAFMYVFCLLAWGLNFIAIKIQGHTVALELSLLYRLAATAVVFLLLTWALKPAGKPRRGDGLFLFGFGLLNLCVSYLLMYYATTWIPAALVTLVFSLKTLSTPLMLGLFLQQTPRPAVFLGGALGAGGVAVLVVPLLQQDTGAHTLLGLGFAVLGTLLTSLGDVCSARNAQHKIHPLYANTCGFAVAALLMLVYVMLRGTAFAFDPTLHYVGALLYLTLVASCLAWLFYLKLVERIGAAASNYMVALFPAVGGLGSIFIGESQPTGYLLLGCALGCLGAAIALRKPAPPQTRP
ncbi:MAG: DMT family transporter [Rhodoferax sp.]|nr:DMT family transporter [Rhodoferax sp.]MDP3652966.1 DMT family transporter [Rhodoferax sp.]